MAALTRRKTVFPACSALNLSTVAREDSSGFLAKLASSKLTRRGRKVLPLLSGVPSGGSGNAPLESSISSLSAAFWLRDALCG
jgi:hypothetical protein